MPETASTSRPRVLELLERFGRDTTSFLTLEPGFRYWFDGPDACVAYVDTGRAWIAAGGPVAPVARETETMAAFAAAARRAGRRARFFGVEHELAVDGRFSVLHLGEQPIWNPRDWDAALRGKRSLREQLRRARAKRVRVREVSGERLTDPASSIRGAVDALASRWLASRPMAPMRFVVHVAPFDHSEHRRFFAAEVADELVGFLVAVPIYARGGWLLQHVLRDPEAPNGTVELMFDHVLRQLAHEGCGHVTFGLAPLANTSSPILRAIRSVSRPLYDFEGLVRFKRKLLPGGWQPVYLAYPAGERRSLAMIDVLAAFAGGSPWRFTLRTLRHRAPAVVAMMACSLVPWIVLLATADTDRWFPSPAVHVGWVIFDVLLFAGLIALARRWRPGLARSLAVAAAVDAALGAAQFLAWNAGRTTGLLDVAIASFAVLAPAAAAVFLWACRARR